MSTKKTKAVKAATKKNTKPAKKRIRKPRTEAQKARRRELAAMKREVKVGGKLEQFAKAVLDIAKKLRLA